MPDPQLLAALGPVLCLYRAGGHGALAGWASAVRATSHSALDSDGLFEGIHFFDSFGRCCWQLYLLPDTDFLAWERVSAVLPAGPGDEHVGCLAERLLRRLAAHLEGNAWVADVVRFRITPSDRTSLHVSAMTDISACGEISARRLMQRAGISMAECSAACGKRQARSEYIQPAGAADFGCPMIPPHPRRQT